MNLNKLIMFLIVCITSIFVLSAPVSASINTTDITDAVNITFIILGTIVSNSGTIISFIVMMFTISLISILLYKFIGNLLGKLTGGIGKERL